MAKAKAKPKAQISISQGYVVRVKSRLILQYYIIFGSDRASKRSYYGNSVEYAYTMRDYSHIRDVMLNS